MSKQVAKDLYQALAERRLTRLTELVHSDFSGTISDGLPIENSGRITGSRALIDSVWGAVFVDFDVTPEPEEILGLEDGRLLVTGRYRGSARVSGKAVDAVFAHVLAFEGGRLTGLDQYTDTHKWHQALRSM